jgi:glycosyltransferase involved in cell wall biosynthesis
MGPPPRRVLLVEANEDGTVGGSHQVMFDTVVRVNRERFEPVVCFYQNNVFAERLRSVGVEVQLLDSFRQRERARQVKASKGGRFLELGRSILRRTRLLQEWRISLLHLNNSPQVGYMDWLPAARLAGVPAVVSAMGDAEPLTGAVHGRLVASFDHYVPVSHYMAGALRRQHIPETRITTVQNGVDVAALRADLSQGVKEEIRLELEVPDGARLGVMVGNLRAWKGQHVVLEALGALGPTDRPWVVAFAGSEDPERPEYGESLRKLARDAGVETQVRWLGRRTDVPRLFAAADAGLHASITPEPFGLVMVECMAVGTPVIAAQEGGASEIVNRQTGWTYPGGDAGALADRLRTVGKLDDVALAALKEACLRHAERFDASRMAREVEGVWARVMSGGRPEGPVRLRPVPDPAPERVHLNGEAPKVATGGSE